MQVLLLLVEWTPTTPSTDRRFKGYKISVTAGLTTTAVTGSQTTVVAVVTLVMFVKRSGVPTAVVNVWAATSFVVVR